MKIAYLSYLYDIDGISLGAKIKALELLSALRQCGHEISIHWLNRQPAASNGAQVKIQTRQYFKEKFAKYLHEPNQIFTNASYFRKESKIIADYSPDLIIARLDAYLLSALIISKLKKIPLLVELDNPVAYEFCTFQPHYISHLSLLRFFEKLNLKHSSFAFTVTQEIKDHYVKQGISAQKIQIISNGANTDQFHPQADCQKIIQRYKLAGSVVVGFVGTFHYWHGIENLKTLILKAMSLGDHVRFLMVGSGGPMKDDLNSFIRAQNLEERAILTGFVPHKNVPEYIAAMDVVLAALPCVGFFLLLSVKNFLSTCPVANRLSRQVSGKLKISFRMDKIACYANQVTWKRCMKKLLF